MTSSRNHRSPMGSKRQLPSGRWLVEVAHGRAADGSRRRQSRTVDTEAEADAAILELAYELGRPPSASGGMTLREYWEFFRRTKGARLAGNTILRYSDAMERHVLPVLGERDIVSIDRQDAQPVVLAAGTPAEARQTKRSWSAVMGQAVIDGLIPSNPLLGRYEYPVEPDAAIDYEEDPFAAIEGSRRVWDARTALRAMPILMGTAIETAWLACIGAGLRNQEAFALRWKDVRRIEVGGREVTQVAVHHAVTLADGRKRTKTPRSVRIASVAEPFGSRLWALRGDPEEPICRLTLANIRRQWKTMWEPCLSKHARKADRIKGIMVDGVEPPIPYLPLARMRATHETLMQEAGVLDSVNAATHGHSQKVSYRHYLSPEATDAAARLGEMLAETADDA